jgi:beta-lactamase class A
MRRTRHIASPLRRTAAATVLLAGLLVGGATAYTMWPRSASSATEAPSRHRLVPAEDPAPAEVLEPRATPERMRRLTQALEEHVREGPGRKIGIYVQDIETGRTAGVNERERFLAASLIKLPVMSAAFELWEEKPELKTRRALTWMEWMITVSDNASTDRLIDLVGGPEVVIQFCEDRGWPDFRVRHAILNHRGRKGLNECTAKEVVEFLVALDQRSLVSEAADAEMWEILRRQQKVARLPAGLPKQEDIVIGNKTGTLSNALHDAGIVHTPRARYAICVLISGQRSEYSANRFCRQISRLVFNTLHGPDPSLQANARPPDSL